MKKNCSKVLFIWIILFVFAIIGEIKCVVKAVNCNWDPIGKSEIFYTVSALTGMGVIVGWINIEDK